MRYLFLLIALLFSTGVGVSITPVAAWAIAVQENGKTSIRSVIVQIDDHHAVVGTKEDTEGLELDGNKQVTKPLKTIPLFDLFDLGNGAPLKRGIVVVCGAPEPST